MRKGIILGIGILVILLALAGTGSASPDGSKPNGFACNNCHSAITSENATFYNQTHRYNDTVINPPDCDNCHVSVSATPFSMNLALKTGAGTLLTSDECAYCHPKLVVDWNLSKHSSSTISASKTNLTMPGPVQCVTCHNEHNANKVVTINTSCLNPACHSSNGTVAGTSKHSYNLTECKFCHMPKVLTVNTPFDARSHSFNYNTQLNSSADDERHAAAFGDLKNVTKSTGITNTSCEMCHGGNSKLLPSLNVKPYRASKHNNTANPAAPFCTDCHKTAKTTEAKQINGTNTCKVSGCHGGIIHVNASEIGSVDCVNCHFNNSNPLRTHELTFATVSNISYTCTICHTANTNRSIVPEINEWDASAHNDREIAINKSNPNSSFYFSRNGTTGTVTISSRENSCNKCHSPIDWNPATDSNTTKVLLTNDFKGIVCTICHNKDDMVNWINTNGQVYGWYNRDAIKVSATVYQANYTKMTDTTELCGNCHSNIRNGSTGPGWASATATTPIKPHGFPAKDMFMGSPKQTGQKFECISCHMYKNTTYGVGTISDSEKVTGHSFAVDESGLQSKTECNGCHDGTKFKTIPDRIEEIQTITQNKWNSTNSSVMAALDRWNKSTGVKGLSADKISRAYWNLKLVESDESWGVHNPAATITLLDEAATLANASDALLGQATSNVDLVQGWNLVALNGTPSVTAPVSVLSSVSSNITVAWGYNATSSAWELYDPAMPTALNTLKTMVPGKGYWINAIKACKWAI